MNLSEVPQSLLLNIEGAFTTDHQRTPVENGEVAVKSGAVVCRKHRWRQVLSPTIVNPRDHKVSRQKVLPRYGEHHFRARLPEHINAVRFLGEHLFGVRDFAGLAPIARDSGKRTGRRKIGGGRAIVRTMLYIAALHASRRCDTFKAFRNRLESSGKPVKAAITATARKLLTVLNAMLAASADFRHEAHE